MFNLRDRVRIVARSEDLRPANGLVGPIGLTDMRRLAERGSYGVSVTLPGKRYRQYVFCDGDELVMAPREQRTAQTWDDLRAQIGSAKKRRRKARA